MIRLHTLLLLACLTAVTAAGDERPTSSWAVARALPPAETKILLDVGKEYYLTVGQLKLLLTIRRIENGRSGLQMGVSSNHPPHRARRHARQPARSLRIQAQWAAGTIRNHYTGNLDAFAKVYCPHGWKHWSRMARYWMNRTR